MAYDDWLRAFDYLEMVHMGPASFARLGIPEVGISNGISSVFELLSDDFDMILNSMLSSCLI